LSGNAGAEKSKVSKNEKTGSTWQLARIEAGQYLFAKAGLVPSVS
jgi:hypothetical protein